MEMFGRNPRLAVVDRIASDLSTCAGKLYRKDENGEEVEITDHPFLNFMAHPNPLYEMTSGACWRLQQIYLELKGEGYFVYEFDALGRPVELWPLPTHWVQQTPYVGYPYYEIRTTGGLIRQIPVDDIFCMKELNPLDPYKRGLGAAESIADEIETDEYAAKFQKKFFYNDATPTTLISMPGSSKDQRDRFRSEWNERFRGPFNSHGIATVDGNVTVTKLAENMRDMDMTEGRRFLRDAVLEHFGVPREIMGITESSNRATSEAAQYIYAQNVIMPRLNRREEAINTQILPFYGNDLVWHFDDVVPRSQEFDKAKGIDGWNAGLLTKDEARELLGMEPCKTGGDCFKITISDMFIGSNDDPAEVTTDLMQESTDEVEVTDDEDTGGMLSMSDRREHEEKSRVQNIGNLLAAAQKAQRAKFEVATMKFFRQQQKRLSGSLSGTEKADWSVWDVLMPYITENHVEDSAAWSALGEQEQKNLVEQFIGGLVNWPSEETAMEEIFKPLWKQTYDEGTRIAKQAYNIRGVDRPELLSQAKLHGGKRVRRVTQTTKENISRIVANGIEAGIGREKMADEILQEYEIQTRSRARLIADQETVMTLETGHYDMMQKSGATTKTWHHRPQKNPRDGSNGGPNHVKMDGETVPIDARFSNGLRYPCDPEGPARETIKCRCYVTYNR
ncbi:phage portal protein [Faecalibacterium sp. Marseille-Q4137]|nr:phage portal protein [Faecalibacterium sp. Marseille-Q4137]